MAKKKITPKPAPYRFRKFVLGFAIGIIFTLFVFYGIRTFYPEPDYSKMCFESRFSNPYPAYKEPSLINQTRCDALVGTIDSLSCEPQYRTTIYNQTVDCYVPMCNTCSEQYDNAREKYDSNVFIISIIAGGIALLAGVILGVEAVGSGLMFGGVLTILFGVIRNWGHLGNIAKFIILGIVLAALIFIGYKKLKD